jgi:hypothetical protein
VYADMFIKSEGISLDHKKECKYNSDCEPGCGPEQLPRCIRGRCWCYFTHPPPSANFP